MVGINSSTKRTNTCAELNEKFVGQNVVLNGWVHRVRPLGALTFILLRDRYGVTQVVIGDDAPEALKESAATLKSEYCVSIAGKVQKRSDKDVNRAMPTGAIEVKATAITIFTKSKPLPFAIDEVRQKDGSLVVTGEDIRLKYRYLDLRREKIKQNIILRSAVMAATVEFLTGEGFLQIETPTFIKSTPEGARDYLVPSRIYHGKFYSLPQSPQLYKQLLMVSGFDKYFQIARCYRDEDARGDRQPEFTQIDMEMSFCEREDVLNVTERLMRHIFKKTMAYELPEHFEKLAWGDAMNWYGSDKPDLRFGLKMADGAFLADLLVTGFDALSEGAKSADSTLARHKRSAVKVLVVKGAAQKYSRKNLEALEAVAKTYKAKALYWTKVDDAGKFAGGVAKFFLGREGEVLSKLGAEKGDLILIVSDPDWQTACTALGAVRKQLGRDLDLFDKADKFHFAWIVDFPYFAWNTDENKWETEHHMFTLPQKEYWPTLEKDPGAVKGDLYDLVLNGYELASGSLRINDPELQERIFEIVGYSRERAEKAFGFLVEAFKYGAPPHGGIAPGLDRLLMIMCGEETIHEVIAFPKDNTARSPMDDAPSAVEEAQLKELGIKAGE